MGYSRYIGRVGALAVALGIGVALANGPATAWADGDDGSPSGPSASDSSSGADAQSDTSGSAGSTGASSDASTGNASPGAGGGTGDAGKEDADDDESTDAAKSGADDPAARDDSTSGSGQPAVERKRSRGSQRESVTPRKSEVKVRSEAASSAKRAPAATTVSNTPTAGAGDTAPQAVSVSETRRSVPISTPVRSADVVDVNAVSTTPSAPAKTVTTAVLSALGLSPLATGGPTDVPDSPVAWAMFAALRRQSDEDAGTEQKVVSVADPMASTMSVEDAAEPMMALAAVANAAPSASPTIGLPESVNGVVTGKLNAVDPESNPLTYAVQSKSAGATVTVDGAGNFTYAPAQAARLQAATTTGLVVDTDTFTVRVSDGQAFTDVPVTVVVRPGQLATGAPVDVGRDPSGVAFNADGTRAYVTNQWDKTVSVVNTSNGAVLATITVPYAPKAVVVSPVAGQNRAYVAMSIGVAVIDTATNKVVDVKPSTSTVDAIAVGASPSALAINPTGTRLYVSNFGSTTVSVVNTATNLEITKITVGSQPSGLAVSADGTRLYALSRANDTVTAINTATNQVLGSAVKVGDSPRNVVISPSGQLYVTNYTSGTVTVLNTTAAAPVFVKTLTVGTQPEGIAIIKDGSLVYVGNGQDTMSVINAATNTVGSTVAIGGTGTSGAHAIAVSGNTMYVTDYVEDWVRVLNVARVQTAPQANGTPTVGTPDATTGTVAGALNVIDTDGDALSYTVTTAPAKGTLTVNPNGTYTYKPTDAARQQAGPTTVDQFTVRVSDTLGAVKDVNVTVPVKPVDANRPPLAGTPSVGMPDRATGAVSGLLNFNDPDNNPMTYSVPVQPASGAVTVTGSTYTYTPTQAARDAAAASQGDDLATVTVFASDGQASTSKTFTVPIAPTPPPNSAPTASPTQSIPNQNTGAIAGAVNGADVDGNPLSYTLTGTPPASGSVTVNPTTGAFTYTPTQLARFAAHDGGTGPDFDSVTVAVSDGQVSTPVTIQVAVLPALIPSISSTAQTGANPMGMAVSPTKTYVANQMSNTVSVIDRANPTATPTTVNVVAAPRAIALSSDGTRAYVAGNGGVSVINTATNQVIMTVATSAGDSFGIGVGPSVNGQHRVYVTNAANNTVRVINANTTTNTYTAGASVTVGTAPRGIAVSPDGNRVYVANWGSNNVSVLNTSTATPALVGSPMTVGTNPIGVVVSPDGSRVYVGNYGSASVSVLNPAAATPLVTTIAVGSQPFGLAITPDGSIVYAANAWDTVSMIHTKTNTVYSTLTIDDQQPEPQWHSVAVSPDGRQVYMSDMADRTVRVATIIRSNTAPTAATPSVAPNPTTGEVTGVVNVKDYDGDSITVTYSQPSNGSVSYNASTGAYTYNPTAAARVQASHTPGMTDTFTVSAADSRGAATSVTVTVPVMPSFPAGVSPIAVGSHPIDITVAGNRLYVTNSGDGSVSVIDTTTNRVINTIGGLGYASPTVASSDGRYLYVSQYDSYYVTASVKVVDTVTGGVVATVTMPRCEAEGCDTPGGGWANSAGITDIAISPDGTRVYVSELWVGDSFYGGTLTMIDTATNKVVGSTQPSQWGDFYSNIEVTPDGTRIYAGSGYPYYPQMDVLDARTLARVGTVPLDGSPGWPPLSMGSLTFSPNGERAFARMTEIWPTYTSQTFAVIDTKPGSPTYNTQIATITVPPGAQYLKVSPDNSRAYVVHNGGELVTIVDTATNTVVGSITSEQIGGAYAALVIGPNGTLYFSNYQANAVYAVAPGTLAV